MKKFKVLQRFTVIALLLFCSIGIGGVLAETQVDRVDSSIQRVEKSDMTFLRGYDWYSHLTERIEYAQDRIWLSTYAISEPGSQTMDEFYQLLHDRAKNGVDVKLFLDGSQQENQKIASQIKGYDFEVVLVARDKDRALHAKINLIDDDWIYVGSANLTVTAFARPVETMIFMENESITRKMEAYLDEFA